MAHHFLHFRGVLDVHGSDQDAKARWTLVNDLLKALGCHDVMISESDTYAIPPHECDACFRTALMTSRRTP